MSSSTKLFKLEEVGNLLEPFIFEQLNEDEYKVDSLPSYKLLTWNRLIVAFDLFYLDMVNKNKALAEKVYFERVRATSLGGFSEFGREEDKNGINSYLDEFSLTFNSIRDNGFDERKSLVPLAQDGSILNGSHRTACAIFLNKNVSCLFTRKNRAVDDYQAFFMRKVPPYILDLVVNTFIQYSNNTYVAFLWPSGVGLKKKARSEFSNIVYEKDVKFTPKGAFNLLVELYKHMEWVGSAEKGFLGVRQKMLECFPSFEPVKVIVFQSNSLAQVQEIKEKVRALYNIGYSSIHITDTKKEAIETGRLIFNENGLHLLNYGDPYKYFSEYRKLDKFKKFLLRSRLDVSSVLVDGSFTLSLYGLRKSQDIDYLTSDDVIVDENELYERHDDQLIFHGVSKSDLLTDPAYYFYFDDLKFVSFAQLYKMKLNRGEKKDGHDCQIMESLLVEDHFKKFAARAKQHLFYFRIKAIYTSRRLLMVSLKQVGLYSSARWLYRALGK